MIAFPSSQHENHYEVYQTVIGSRDDDMFSKSAAVVVNSSGDDSLVFRCVVVVGCDSPTDYWQLFICLFHLVSKFFIYSFFFYVVPVKAL